jgi:hypothetical protein
MRRLIMRAVVILVAVVASIASTCDVNAQSSNSQPAAPQVSPPNVSSPMSQSSEPPRGIPQAPVGHRQPRAGDVPNEGTITRSETDVELDRKLNICRGC